MNGPFADLPSRLFPLVIRDFSRVRMKTTCFCKHTRKFKNHNGLKLFWKSNSYLSVIALQFSWILFKMFHKKIHSETKDIILNWNLISEWILTKCVEVASCETIILVCHVAVGSRRLLTSKFSTNWGLSSLLLAKTGISAKAEVRYTHLQKFLYLCKPTKYN